MDAASLESLITSVPFSSGASQFRGVTRKGALWQASIRHAGKNQYLGIYLSEHDAARAYDQAAVHNHGRYRSMWTEAVRLMPLSVKAILDSLFI